MGSGNYLQDRLDREQDCEEAPLWCGSCGEEAGHFCGECGNEISRSQCRTDGGICKECLEKENFAMKFGGEK
jgi:hypothetical protein